MSTYQFMTIFSATSGLSKDKFVNTMRFHTDAVVPGDFDNVRDLLKDFYTIAPSGLSITQNMANTLSTTVAVKAYNLDDPKPRTPVYESTFLVPAYSGGASFPNEVALCLSYEADRVSGEPQGRRRNRIYLGPLSSLTGDSTARPTAAVVSAVNAAAGRLKVAADASISWDWVVYSPTNDNHMPVKHHWVDNAWDTQRRRGLAATSRTQTYY